VTLTSSIPLAKKRRGREKRGKDAPLKRSALKEKEKRKGRGKPAQSRRGLPPTLRMIILQRERGGGGKRKWASVCCSPLTKKKGKKKRGGGKGERGRSYVPFGHDWVTKKKKREGGGREEDSAGESR